MNQTMNEQTFTCIGRGHGAPAMPATRRDWERLRNEPWLAEMCRRIVNGEEPLKQKLPIWTPLCAEFKDNHRSVADALMPLPRLMLDFDEKGHSQEILQKSLELKEQGRWDVLLVEESVRRGTHVLITLPAGMEVQEAQTRFSADVGFQADPALKDVARCIYMVPASHTLYVDEKMFERPSNTVIQSGGESEAKNLENTAQPRVDDKEKDTPPSGGEGEGLVTYPSTYDGIPYPLIVEVLEEQMGGQPEHGSRNTFIFSMACHLRHVCNDDAEWISLIMPTYGENRTKVMSTIRSACSRNQTKSLPRILKRTLAVCKQRMADENPDTDSTQTDPNEPPRMPRRLPPLIRLLVSKTPSIYQPAVAHAVFPALGAHLWKTYFRYIDNVAHEATLMCCLMAGTGAGKNCISEPVNRILADIRQRDAENMLREKEWKRETSTKGANKDKRERPEGLVIQEIDPDTTNAAFVQRLSDGEGRFLYAKMNEIDQFDALKTSARSQTHFQIMCLAFDPGNVYGQTRVGTNSVSERVCIRFNWNASTTIKKGKAYFRHVLTDGPVSRINFCTIPERPIGAEMPVYGRYDAAFDEELHPYIERLNNARGYIECRPARMLARKLMEENADFARLSQSRVFENLSFRANVIAFLKACILYLAHDRKWDKTMEDFVRWSLRYDMWCKMRFFGREIEEMEARELNERRPGPQNLLDHLPDIFTRDQAKALRQRMGIKDGSLKQMLGNWRYRGYIELHGEEMKKPELGRQQYAKTQAYLQRGRSQDGFQISDFS